MKALFNLIKLLSASEKRNLALVTAAMVAFVMYWVVRRPHMRGFFRLRSALRRAAPPVFRYPLSAVWRRRSLQHCKTDLCVRFPQ